MKNARILCCEAQSLKDSQKPVIMMGHVAMIRRLGGVTFLVLRDRTGTIQAVLEEPLSEISIETPVLVRGKLTPRPDNQGVELKVESFELLAEPASALCVEVHKDKKIQELSLNALFDYRPLTLRNQKVKAIFKIAAEICRSFSEFLYSQGFTEIHSSKIVSTGTEGGAQLFALDYFGKSAYLAQSPQFYKQIMVGVFERVFEIAPVYRAEEHDTSRHINEYISLDLEMGFIESEQDVITLQIDLMKHIFASLTERCAKELALYNAQIPVIETIPQITLSEACQLLKDKCGWQGGSQDLDPEGEKLLCQYFAKNENSQLVYVTQYPRDMRPFYAKPLENTKLTRSFDLLFAGQEITTGGQRIHQFKELIGSIETRGLQPDNFADYLQCFRYGMPPHGGLAIGLERLTKQLLGLSNIKEASLFPRDRNRITP